MGNLQLGNFGALVQKEMLNVWYCFFCVHDLKNTHMKKMSSMLESHLGL